MRCFVAYQKRQCAQAELTVLVTVERGAGLMVPTESLILTSDKRKALAKFTKELISLFLVVDLKPFFSKFMINYTHSRKRKNCLQFSS